MRTSALSSAQLSVRIAGSGLYELCCTSSLCLASGEFYLQFCGDVDVQPNYLASGCCTTVVSPLPKNAREEGVKGMQQEIGVFLIALEEAYTHTRA